MRINPTSLGFAVQVVQHAAELYTVRLAQPENASSVWLQCCMYHPFMLHTNGLE